MGKIKKVWPPDSPYYRWYVRLDKYFSRKHRYSSDENFRQSVNQQRKTANMMARIFQVVLPLCLILLFSCNEPHGKMISPVAAKWKAGDTFEVIIHKKNFQLSDTSGYVNFPDTTLTWPKRVVARNKNAQSFAQKVHYIRDEPNFRTTILNNEQHFTIGYSTKAYAPLILSDSYGVMIRDSSGTVLAQRDTIGTWHIYDCSKALEETYKILFNKYKQ